MSIRRLAPLFGHDQQKQGGVKALHTQKGQCRWQPRVWHATHDALVLAGLERALTRVFPIARCMWPRVLAHDLFFALPPILAW
jgi:hypothetical protein